MVVDHGQLCAGGLLGGGVGFLIELLSLRFNVPRNYMFIGCPGNSFPHNIADLGGVRLIV